MTNPLVREYQSIRSAFERAFNHTNLFQLSESEKSLPLNSDKLRSWPSIVSYFYFDYLESDDPILRRNVQYLMNRDKVSESAMFNDTPVVGLTVFEWTQSYLSYVYNSLNKLGYDVTPTNLNFQEIPQIHLIFDEEEREVEEFIIDTTSTVTTTEGYSEDNEGQDGEGLNVLITGKLSFQKYLIQPFPDPKIIGIRVTDELTVDDLNLDVEILAQQNTQYIIRSPPRIMRFRWDLATGMLESGADYNEIIREIWVGNYSPRMRSKAIALCYQLISGRVYVPISGSLVVINSHPKEPIIWNARTSALFMYLGIFLVVFELREQNCVTKQVVHEAYEFLMRVIDFPVSKQKIIMRVSHIYGDQRFNYSLNDLGNQLSRCDWAALFWNYIQNETEPNAFTHLLVWIKIMLARSGNAVLKINKDQVTVPSPFVRQTFQKFKSGEFVPLKEFQTEMERIIAKPYDLSPNTITECKYSFPKTISLGWDIDKGDSFGDEMNARCLILFTAIYIRKTYSIQNLVDMFKKH